VEVVGITVSLSSGFVTTTVDTAETTTKQTTAVTTEMTTKQTTATITSPDYATAPAIQVRYQSTDAQVISIWSSIFSHSNESQSGLHSSSPPPGPDAVSGGAIAGIVIGIIAGLAAVGALVMLLHWRRKRRSKQPASVEDDKWNKPELDSKAVEYHELDADRELMEMDQTSAIPVELPGHHLEDIDQMRRSPIMLHEGDLDS
jgi:hypothetical protein